MPVATLTIADGGTTSNSFGPLRGPFIALKFPASMTGSSFGFVGCDTEGGTYATVYDDAGAAISLTVTSSVWVTLSPDTQARVAPIPFLKLVIGSAQSGAKTILVSGAD